MSCLRLLPARAKASALALVAAGFWHCQAPVEPCEPLDVDVSLASYNLANRTGSDRATIAEILTSLSPDFMALQECVDCDDLLTVMPADFALTENRRAGVAIIFDSSRWSPSDEGTLLLGSNDDNWGDRVLHWTRFAEHTGGSEVIISSTHWCVPIRSEDDTCTAERLLEYAQSAIAHLAEHVDADCPILFAGDLNLFGDEEQTAIAGVFADAGFVDLIAAAPVADLEPTFAGNSWAPPARLDYIFGRWMPGIKASAIDRSAQAMAASDHFPVFVELGD